MKRKDQFIHTLKEFSENKEKTGGVTGSWKTTLTQDNDVLTYQVKPSIFSNPSTTRKIKAGYMDKENIGELLSATIARVFCAKGTIPQVVPIYDEDKKEIMIGSKYLDNVVGTLDQYVMEKHDKVQLSKGGKHVSFVKKEHEDKKNGCIAFESLDKGIKEQVAKAIVASALVGDHDVNPGNMVVCVDKNDQVSVARIDFGHAFNDLIVGPNFFGGGMKNRQELILDFFNRDTILGFKVGGDQPKLWRDYPGIVPSNEVVEALRKLAGEAEGKVNEIRGNLVLELFQLGKKLNDEKAFTAYNNLVKSLMTIAGNLSGMNDFNLSDQIPFGDFPAFIENISNKLVEYLENNCVNAKSVADLMEYQMKIDDFLSQEINKESKGVESNNFSFPVEPVSIKKNNVGENKITWVKIDKDTPAFMGTLSEYIEHRRHVLTATKSKAITTEKTNSNEVSFVEALLFALFDYINTRKSEGKSLLKSAVSKFKIQGYSEEEKVAACEALIYSISSYGNYQGEKPLNFYKGVLSDGRLAKTIQGVLKQYPNEPQTIDKLIEKFSKNVVTSVDKNENKNDDIERKIKFK